MADRSDRGQVPELYFDDHTLECLRRASDVFLKHLLEEMHELQERLAARLSLGNVAGLLRVC